MSLEGTFRRRYLMWTTLTQKMKTMIGLAEWVKGKKIVSCPFGKKEPEKFGFDITKADKIFDLLLQQGHIKLSQFHTIPFAEELKRMKY
jgi:hypothetical protein